MQQSMFLHFSIRRVISLGSLVSVHRSHKNQFVVEETGNAICGVVVVIEGFFS